MVAWLKLTSLRKPGAAHNACADIFFHMLKSTMSLIIISTECGHDHIAIDPG